MADQHNESNIYGSEFVDAVIDNGSAGPARTIRSDWRPSRKSLPRGRR